MSLGTNPDGTVQVPPLDQAMKAGWYSPGASPGEAGNAVIVGHVDSAQLGPAVFFNLGALVAGDTIVVTRQDGRAATFTVREVGSYPKTAFPAAQVYGPSAVPALRVVTCGGVFDRTAGSYLNNIVVYAPRTGLRAETARGPVVGSRPPGHARSNGQAAAEVRTRVRIWRSSTDSADRSARDSSNSPIARCGPVDRGGVRLLPLLHPLHRRHVVRGGAEHLGGERGQRGVQVVAQRHPGQRLPAVLARQQGDLRQQRVDPEPVGEHEVDRGHLADVPPGACARSRRCRAGRSRTSGGSPARPGRAAALGRRATRCAPRWPPARVPRNRCSRSRQEPGHAGAQPGDLAGHVDRRAAVGDQPAHRAVEQPPGVQVDARSATRAGPCCPAPRPRPRASRSPNTSRTTTYARSTSAARGGRLLDHPEDERDAAPVDRLVDQDRGDDVPAQPVLGHPARRSARRSGVGK